jgi:hypothetical protein
VLTSKFVDFPYSMGFLSLDVVLFITWKVSYCIVGGSIALGILCSLVLFYGNGCCCGHGIYGSRT